MKKALFALFLFHSFLLEAQLTASNRSVNIGNVYAATNAPVDVKVLNQSRSEVAFSFIPGDKSGVMILPDVLQPYESDLISFRSGYQRSHRFSHKVFFESERGTTSVTISGKYEDGGISGQDCEDFSKGKIKVRSKKQKLVQNPATGTIRIYDKADRNTLFAADPEKIRPAHLILLLDASGSMGSKDRLNQIKDEATALVNELRPTDMVSILRYSEGSETILSKTPCSDMELIYAAIDTIVAGGFTNGKEGIESALVYARDQRSMGRSNHIVMLTDGDFNLGQENEGIRRLLLGENRSMDYHLSVWTIGSSSENARDMKDLSDAGNGYFFQLDGKQNRKSINKMLIKQLSS